MGRLVEVAWPIATIVALSLTCILFEEAYCRLGAKLARVRLGREVHVWQLARRAFDVGMLFLSLYYWSSFGTASRWAQWVVACFSTVGSILKIVALLLVGVLMLLSGEQKWIFDYADEFRNDSISEWAWDIVALVVLFGLLLVRLGYGDARKRWEQVSTWWLGWSLPLVVLSFSIRNWRPTENIWLYGRYSAAEWLELLRVAAPVLLWFLGLAAAVRVATSGDRPRKLDALDRIWRLLVFSVVIGFHVPWLVLLVVMLVPSVKAESLAGLWSAEGFFPEVSFVTGLGATLAMGLLWWLRESRQQRDQRSSRLVLEELWALTLPAFASFAMLVGLRGSTRQSWKLGILWTAGEVLLLLLVLGWNRWRKIANEEDDLISRWAWASLGVWSVGTAVAVTWFWLGWDGADRLLPPFILSLGWLQYSAFEPWLVRWVVYALLRGVVFAFSLRWMASPPSRDVAVA